MKRFRELILPALFALIFIFATGYISAEYTSIVFLQDFCFMFHVIPFGIGFSGGENYLVVIYYIVLWIVLTFTFLGILRLAALIFKRTA